MARETEEATDENKSHLSREKSLSFRRQRTVQHLKSNKKLNKSQDTDSL